MTVKTNDSILELKSRDNWLILQYGDNKMY